MNKEALLKVAEILDKVNPEKFDLKGWKCGTTACACGHAAMDPWFYEQGFSIKGLEPYLTISYKGLQGWDAIEEFFDLNINDSFYLFEEDSYEDGFEKNKKTPPLEVADRIREFVKGV